MSKSSKNLNTTRFVKIVSPLAVAIALAACGGDSSFGGGNSGKSSDNPTTQEDPFKKSLNSKCTLYNNNEAVGFGAKITDEGLEDNEYNKIKCYSSTNPDPLVKKEREYLVNKYPKVEYFSTKSDHMADLKSIPNFPILKELRISHFSQGEVPLNEVLPSFDGLQNLTSKVLTKLEITGHNASDLTPLQGLTSLKKLHIAKSHVDMTKEELTSSVILDASPLSNLTKLNELTLAYTGITDVDFITQLKSLKRLDLSRNNIKDISALKNLSKTTDVYLSKNKIVDAKVMNNWKGVASLVKNCIPEVNYPVGVDRIDAGLFPQDQKECSADGGSGGGTVESKVASIIFKASSRELQSNGSKPVTISVVTKDIKNNLLKGEEVNFSVDKDANLEINPSTGAVHTAVLTPGTAENRTLTVTVSSGDITKTIKVEVVGTSLIIDGPEAITFNKTLPFVLKLKDSDNKPLAFKDVELSSAKGNLLSTTGQTNAKGEIEFTLTGTVGGDDQLVAKALGAEFTKEVKISGDEFTLTGDLDDVNVGINNTLTLEWKNNGTPQANKTININATRGVLSVSTVTTDNNGKATFTISSPKAGQTIVTVTTLDGLSTSLKGEFVATTPKYINTQADPKLVAPKGSSTIVAKIRDLADNPIKNKTIIFNLEDTVNGSLSQGSAVTDSLGRATVSYTAGDASSAKDGVVIKTYVQSAPTIADEIKLTVGGKALRIVLGHDHLVAADEIFYTKTYGVIVTDSAGNPIKDQNIDFTITPTQYYKGRLIYTENGDDKQWVRSLTATCPSEDFDNDGNLDDGEDANGNGKLEPTHDAAVTGSGVTDENGKITVQVVYPKSRAWWSDQAIEASTTVGGTEYLERTEFTLPVLAADVKSENPPPNSVSPYGTWGSCSDDPAGTPPVVTPTPAPPVVRIIESASKVIVGSVQNSTTTVKWYAVTIDGKRAVPNLDYTINDSGKVSVQMGNNNDFKLTDNNIAVDDSGFYLSINTIKTDDRPLTTSLPVYYQDDTGSTQSSNIILNGGYKDGKATTITLNVGETYVEYGATAKSLITGKDLGVKSYGSVDTTVAGTTVIVYVAVDESGKTVTTTRTVVVKDSDVPVITLNGGNISLSVGTPLPIDGSLSATAVDTSDGDLSGSIVIDSTSVDISTVGTYYIYYSVTDINGNTAVTRRTVTVQ